MTVALDLTAPVLARQHALITRRQALRAGLRPGAIRSLVDRGVWQTIDHGLYGPTGVPMTWRRRLMAAALLAPGRSLISHRAAAALRGLGGLDEPTPEITIPRGTTFRRPDVITHESVDLPLAEVVVVDGIPTTGLCRLAIDLGAVVSPSHYAHTMRALRHGHGITSPQLLRTYLRHKQRGRNGGGALRDWLDRYFHIEGTSESGVELLVLDALLDAGLPTPVRQHWVVTASGRFRLDLAWPAHKVALEVDGAQHDDPDIAAADRRRTAALEAAGWRIVRVRTATLASDLWTAIGICRGWLL